MTKQPIPVLIAAAAFVAGCGGSSGGAEPSTAALSPQQVVDQYRNATIEGDGEAACALVSDSVRADVVEDGSSECVSRFAALGDLNTPDDVAAEKAMHPKAVVSGDRAVAKFKSLGGHPAKIVLEKQDGAWRVVDSPEIANFKVSNS